MKGTEFAGFIRARTKTDTDTFTNADMVTFANIWKDRIAPIIAMENKGFLGLIEKSDLVADQREYSLSDKLLGVSKIEAKIDGTNWQELRPFDPSTRRNFTGDETRIKEAYAGHQPEYIFLRNSIYIFSGESITAVTEGLRAWVISYPADISTSTLSSSDDLVKAPSTTTAGIPVPFQEIMARGAIIEWKEANGINLTRDEEELKAIYSPERSAMMLSRFNQDRETLIAPPSADWMGEESIYSSEDNPLDL